MTGRNTRVSRRMASPTRAITNRGDIPKFIGEIPSEKVQDGQLPFDSIPAMECFTFLEWCLWVKWIEFEPEEFYFPASGMLPTIRCIPDFRATAHTGEFKMIEAKSRRDKMSAKTLERLEFIRQHFAARGIIYEVIYRSDLQANGFIDTIALLRRFGYLKFPQQTINRARQRLATGEAADLETWVARAQAQRIPLSVLHYLLYRQQLPLIYRNLMHPEIRHWRA